MNGSAPPRAATFTRHVLPFALIPPLMILFAMRDHPQVYRLDPAATNWEWIGLVVFVAEVLSVNVVAAMLRLTAPRDRLPPSKEHVYLVAAEVSSPLWASAVVLAIPSLAALVAVHLIAHAVSLRTLYRAVRARLHVEGELEALHIAYMVYSVPAVLWVPLLLMIFVSLSPA